MIPIAKPIIGKEEERAVLEVLRSGKLAQGEVVAEFEEAFAGYCGMKYAVATDNGTSALMVALTAASVGPGDEVITTPFTFFATASTILFTGAKPVFVDIDPETYNINPKLIEAAITKKTKAIIPVHLYGLMADMETINKIAKKHKLIVIEDAAQAHGADIRGKKAGTWGLAATFSFYPTKNMTTGEGGMVTTNDSQLAARAKLFRNQGMQKLYYHDTLGYNFRMTNIAAVIGIEQLKKLESFTKKRIENADFLTRKLRAMNNELITPHVPGGYRHVFHQYTIRTANRDSLIARLKKADIGYGIYYPLPIHKQKPFKTYSNQKFPESEKSAKKVLSLPVNPSVSKRDIDTISRLLT
ncbi:MAG: DegT/DnrJ/EryC1/StrS family aminotransferase [Candidatus Woykebacteria bacterium]